MKTPFDSKLTLLYADCEIKETDKFNKFLNNLVDDKEDLNIELNEDYTMTDFIDEFSTDDIMNAIRETKDIGVKVIKYY
jgi:hypothetical protein